MSVCYTRDAKETSGAVTPRIRRGAAKFKIGEGKNRPLPDGAGKRNGRSRDPSHPQLTDKFQGVCWLISAKRLNKRGLKVLPM